MADILVQIRTLIPSLAEHVAQIEDFAQRKLFHQLTQKLEEVMAAPEMQQGDLLVQLFHGFTSRYEAKMSPMTVSFMAVKTAQKYSDPHAAIQFLDGLTKTVGSREPSAKIILQSEMAATKLRAIASPAESAVALREVKTDLENIKVQLEQLGDAENIVNSAFYRVDAEYLKASNSPNEFYRAALLYLAYTPIASLSLVEQRTIAFDVGLAALMGDNIYSFGELLSHPVVLTLEGTPVEWLLRLLQSFNSGNITAYETIVNTYQAQLQSQPALVERAQLLKEKIQLMSLVELVFNLPAGDRTLPFSVVSSHTKVGMDEVEFVLLKALALSLIKGVIDQVSQTISVTWVQPRVLEVSQIATIRDKLDQWRDHVQSTFLFLEQETPDLVV